MSNLLYKPSLRFPFLARIISSLKQSKVATLICVLLFVAGSLSSLAQSDTWVQKNDVGYNAINVSEPSARTGAVGFSIGTKGYLGTGWNQGSLKDFWEYNSIDNTWTQKADFAGDGRERAVAFSIGTKGYLGTGFSSEPSYTYYKDFWEYDPATNNWARKADFGGAGRERAVGFSIGTKGYIGTGTNYSKDLWEYDPAINNWAKKADFGGAGREGAVGFSIGTKGYIGTGYVDNNQLSKDFWEFDPVTNIWTQKADFGGTTRGNAVGFSIDNKGYMGTGTSGYPDFTSYKDFWEFDPAANKWKQKADFEGTARLYAISFSIEGKGYLGTGNFDNEELTKDFWEFDPAANIWTQKADFGGIARHSAVGFSIGSNGYIGTGYDGSFKKDFWEYNPAANTWAQKADFEGIARYGAVGFSISGKGYLGTGYTGYPNYYVKDFWEYDPATNKWIQKADFGGVTRVYAVGFGIEGKGYLGTGLDNYGGNHKDFWEYDPVGDRWTQKADFGGVVRYGAVSFSISSKGYVGTGVTNISPYGSKDFWEYDPVANIWTQRANFGGTACRFAVGFSISGKGYLGTGLSYDGIQNYYKEDFWEFDPASNIWKVKHFFGGSARSTAVGFNIGSKGYLGTGYSQDAFYTSSYYKDFWEYTPSDALPLQLLNFTAFLQKTNAVLKWQTDNEINTSHFNIQRSFNGSNFANIAKQNAAGNGVKQEYIYSDENVTALQQSTIFYRLQMVDKDASFTYSNIVQLKLNNSNGVQFSISPNPVKDKLHISISCTENTTLSIRIVDMQGRQVYTANLNAVAGTIHKDIDVSKMAKGVYSIQLISDKGTSKGSFVKE